MATRAVAVTAAGSALGGQVAVRCSDQSSAVAALLAGVSSSSSIGQVVSAAAHPLFDEVTVRTLRRDEIAAACELLVGEWPSIPSLGFHYALYDAYPGGWLCATVGDAVVGTMFFSTFPDGSGFGGYFCVRKDYRSKGVGKRLQDACLAHFSNANFGINAVESRVPTNIRAGYRVVSFRILSFYGTLDVGAVAARLAELAAGERSPPLSSSSCSSGAAVALAEVRRPPEELLRYDAEVNVARRDAFVRLYMALPESHTLVARRQRDGAVVGYGTLHRGAECYQISPLYADDADTAELIFLSLAARILSGEALCYTAPALNAAAVRLAESVGLPFDYATVRQYTKCEVPVPQHKVYSVATEDASFA